MNELDADPRKLIKVLNYDGMPITADTIMQKISSALAVPTH
jgi:2-oxoglutarate ferredoxin oxidoreductase subunit alpha